MNEYVDYYKEHCLNILKGKVKTSKGEVIEIQGEIILNDISNIDYEQAVAFAHVYNNWRRRTTFISKNVFDMILSCNVFIGNLNARKLWRLSVLLYAMVTKLSGSKNLIIPYGRVSETISYLYP